MTPDVQNLPATPAPRRVLGQEVVLVLALSLGASGVAALITFLGAVTAPQKLSHQTAKIVVDVAPHRPWLGLAWQVFYIVTALVPVALVAHLLARGGESLRRTLGFSFDQKGRDLIKGALVAAGIGGSGLLLYLAALQFGVNRIVLPTDLPAVWWRIPVLVASAIQNAVLEEIVVLGFLVHRLTQIGWNYRRTAAVSSVIRGSYHLYQGVGGFFGNMVMGVIFYYLYRRWGRVMPLVVAHSIIDIVAFVGSVLLAGRVSWLPKS